MGGKATGSQVSGDTKVAVLDVVAGIGGESSYLLDLIRRQELQATVYRFL